MVDNHPDFVAYFPDSVVSFPREVDYIRLEVSATENQRKGAHFIGKAVGKPVETQEAYNIR